MKKINLFFNIYCAYSTPDIPHGNKRVAGSFNRRTSKNRVSTL